MVENTNDQISEKSETTVAPQVLLDITRLAALGVEGVNQLAPVPGGVNRLFKRGASEGVQIIIDSNSVIADIYVILEHHTNIRMVGREIQTQVARAISEMVGMDVGKVNVHVEDFANYPTPQSA